MLQKLKRFQALALCIFIMVSTIAWSDPAFNGGRITYGQTVDGSVSNPNGDRWIFDGEAGDVIQISLDGAGDFDPFLELYGPIDNFLTEDDDSGPSFNALIDNFRLPDTGPHTIIARGYGRQIGAYTLTLDLDQGTGPGATEEPGGNAGVGGELQFGELVRGNITNENGVEWTFDADTGDVITIVLNGLYGLDTYLELYDDNDRFLVSDDDSGIGLNARIYDYRISQTGTYHVIAAGFGGELGEYELILDHGISLGSVYERGELSFSEGISGEVMDPVGDIWTFEGNEDDVVTISMEGIDDFDSYLVLFLPSGGELAQDDDGGVGFDAMIRAVQLPETGKYFVVTRGFDGEFGEYILTIELGSGLDRRTFKGTIEIGESISDQVDSSWGDLWTFEGDEGSYVTIILEGHDDFDTYLELYGPSEEFLAEDDDGGVNFNAMLRGYQLPETGEFSIVARGYQHDLGEYTLSLLGGAGFGLENERGNILAGEVMQGEVTSQFGDSWTFEGTSGEIVSISLEGIDGFDTYLELYNPEEELLMSDDDGGADFSSYIDRFTLPMTGEYIIIARGYDGGGGEYRLSINAPTGGIDQPPIFTRPTENIASISEVACGIEDTFFVITFPRYIGTQRSYQDEDGNLYWPLITITSIGGEGDVRGIYPVASSIAGDLSELHPTIRLGLFEMDESVIRTLESGLLIDGLYAMFADAFREFERVDIARIAPISSEQADLLIWNAHPPDGMVSITMQWVPSDENGNPIMSDIDSPFPSMEFFPCDSE